MKRSQSVEDLNILAQHTSVVAMAPSARGQKRLFNQTNNLLSYPFAVEVLALGRTPKFNIDQVSTIKGAVSYMQHVFARYETGASEKTVFIEKEKLGWLALINDYLKDEQKSRHGSV